MAPCSELLGVHLLRHWPSVISTGREPFARYTWELSLRW